MIRNTTSNWGSVARAFHWILGLTIIGMLAFGWWMNHIPTRPDRFFYRSIHADIGYLLLALMVLRLVWRWINPVPAMPADTPKWERIGARAGHFALYAVVFLVIMLGWAHSGARPQGDYGSFFGLFHVPQFTSPDKATADAFEDRHIYAAYVLLALIVIHLGAAAWHHFIKRDGVATRMVDGKAG
jgi:cytochrome b561